MRLVILLAACLAPCAAAQTIAVIPGPAGSVGHHLARQRAAPAGVSATAWDGYLAAVGTMPASARAAWLAMPIEMVPRLARQAWEYSRLERQLVAQQARVEAPRSHTTGSRIKSSSY